MAPLEAFLLDAARTPFAWGTKDCLIWPADWIKAQRGIDLAQPFRGCYATALGCQRILSREGGLLALSERQALACGLVETVTPRPGCVGVVQALTAKGFKPIGAIFTGRRWAVLTSAGLAIAPFPLLKAWEV